MGARVVGLRDLSRVEPDDAGEVGQVWHLSGGNPAPDAVAGVRDFEEIRRRYYHRYHGCMTTRKHRLTVTVDPDLVEAGTRAVAEGEAESLSGWVSTALAEKVHRDQHLAHLRAAIGDHEAEFGEITADEIAAQQRADREDAIVVRGRRPARRTRSRKARSA